MPTSRWAAGLLACLLLGCAHQGVAAPAEPAAPRAPARDRATTPEENLVAFARVYGYVRFFHPTDASQQADWQRLAVAGVQEVHDAPTLDVLAQRLDALFRPLAPSLQLWVDGEPPPPLPVAPTRRDGLVYWQYQGFPGSWVSLHRAPYVKARVHPDEAWRRRFAESPSPDARVEVQLAPSLHLRLPVVLSAEQAERAARAPTPALDPSLDLQRDHHVLAVRQAAVIEAWNVLRHFYPYQQELALDWDAMLVSSLRDAEDDGDVASFRDTLRGLLEPLHDGHGYVGHRRHAPDAALPVRIELVEGHAVVTGTHDPDRFAIGDVITEIDGRPAIDRIEQIAARLSGTPQWRQFRAAAWEVPRAALGDEIELVLERDGQQHRMKAQAERGNVPIPPRPPPLHAFEDGVRYVDLTRVTEQELEAEIPLLAAAPGVVFDMRGYPTENDVIIDHLLDEPEDTLWMHVPRFVEPDGRVVAWHDIGWHRRPAAPHIEAPVAFLTSAEAISYAESVLSYVEAHELGTLVGTPTAGANGDIVRFDTLGGFYLVWSGMRVTRHDGSPFHHQGVRPHVEVHPTLAGLRAGRDEVLEAGLDVVRRPAATMAARGQGQHGKKPRAAARSRASTP
ncbi:S41 family peptidase [Paraliomyxa miuraensis]|uniref:S41 family peptidase n=1 Tax=Paraliomyxa miuraensis TaxID=376150 RepID=UPI0022547920|nr:S41 family peptidase [Paraliomyxa miuraensis]MCX4240316.1 S41 family peptidase [Paraliomyxa miuraensis]